MQSMHDNVGQDGGKWRYLMLRFMTSKLILNFFIMRKMHHDKRMNECTRWTMNTRWKKTKTRNGDLRMWHTDDLMAILKYHAIDECFLM